MIPWGGFLGIQLQNPEQCTPKCLSPAPYATWVCVARFQGLFRNFGSAFLPVFEKVLARRIADTQESNQRCALEMLAGIMRGSKHWGFAKVPPSAHSNLSRSRTDLLLKMQLNIATWPSFPDQSRKKGQVAVSCFNEKEWPHKMVIWGCFS